MNTKQAYNEVLHQLRLREHLARNPSDARNFNCWKEENDEYINEIKKQMSERMGMKFSSAIVQARENRLYNHFSGWVNKERRLYLNLFGYGWSL